MQINVLDRKLINIVSHVLMAWHNSKLPKNNNHVQINLNQNTSEIKETLGNDNKKTETIKNSVIPNKILKIPKTKSNKKLNVSTCQILLKKQKILMPKSL